MFLEYQLVTLRFVWSISKLLAKHQKELIQNESQPSADAERADAARGMWQPIGHIRIDPYWFWLKYQQQIINITNEDSRNYNTQKNR